MTDKHGAVQRRFTQVTEGEVGKEPRTFNVEVCVECGEREPMRRKKEEKWPIEYLPARVCWDCRDGRNGRWVLVPSKEGGGNASPPVLGGEE